MHDKATMTRCPRCHAPTLEPGPGMSRLTPRQERFIAEYLVDLNATQAAIRAGYSKKTANEQAARLLAKVSIQRAIADGRAHLTEQTGIDTAFVVDRLRMLGVSDIRRIFDERGRLRPIHDLPDDIAACIAGIEVVSSRIPGSEPVEVKYIHKIKLWDKLGALELLGKYVGAFQPQPLPPSQDRLPLMIFVQHNEFERDPAAALRAASPSAPLTIEAHATEVLPVMEMPPYGMPARRRSSQRRGSRKAQEP